jgi:hypothetical protein
MITSTRLRRALVATAGAAALVLGATAATASGPDTANPGTDPAPDKAAVSALFPAGSELQFVAVAPCRIVDTRNAGGAIVAASRTFDATLADYSGQGGKAGSCNLPTSGVSAVQINLGAISKFGSTSNFKGWATGSAEPLASMVNYDPSGPVANMVTMPVNASGQFTLKTLGSGHTFIDVAGYYVKPLYAAVSSSGAIYQGIASGVVSVSRTSTGFYDVKFNRDVEQCSAVASSITWSSNTDVSPDVSTSADPTVVQVGITNPSNTFVDEYFTLRLTC